MNDSIRRVPTARGLAWVTQALDVAGRRPGLVLSAMLLGAFAFTVALTVMLIAIFLIGVSGHVDPTGNIATEAGRHAMMMALIPTVLVTVFVSPLLYAGWLHVLREVDAGRPVGLSAVFVGLTGGRVLPLASIGLVQLATMALNLLASHLLGGERYVAAYMDYMSSLASGTLVPPPVPEQAALLLVASLAIGFFGFTAQVYAVPQVLFQGRRPLPAVLAALRASAINVLPLTVAGVVMLVGLIAGTLMLVLVGTLLVFLAGAVAKLLGSLVGMLIALFAMALVLALLFGGIYLSWRDMFGDAEEARVAPQMQAEL